MNMALDPLCEYCDLQSSGLDPVFCPDETAIHILEDCSAFSLLRIHHYQNFKLNLEDLINSKTPLSTTLNKMATFSKRAGCFKKTRFTEPISPRRWSLQVLWTHFQSWVLHFVPTAQHNTTSTSCRCSTEGLFFQFKRSRPLIGSAGRREMIHIIISRLIPT